MKLFWKKDNKRSHPKNVKSDQEITIEYHMVVGGVCNVKCLNNDPHTKKILIEIKYSNYKEAKVNETQKVVLDYKGPELKNFHLLNENKYSDMQTLRNRLKEAIKNEEYEMAEKLTKKIERYGK